jgi:hypothetical protein
LFCPSLLFAVGLQENNCFSVSKQSQEKKILSLGRVEIRIWFYSFNTVLCYNYTLKHIFNKLYLFLNFYLVYVVTVNSESLYWLFIHSAYGTDFITHFVRHKVPPQLQSVIFLFLFRYIFFSCNLLNIDVCISFIMPFA